MFGECIVAIFYLDKTRRNMEIKRIWEKSEDYFADGALIYVHNGKGFLYSIGSVESENKTYFTLMFKDMPLFYLQGDEYFCPTCEKIVRSGYQLEQTNEFHVDAINKENTSFEEALCEIQPILGLLKDGYYCVWDTMICPTDGNGNLFWDYPNDEHAKHGSCVYYRGDSEWATCWPHYTIATQPRRKMSKERVEYYRKRPECRAIAYYMDGNLTALIDGHHKAMAAALEHREVKTLVISPCYHIYHTTESGEKKLYLAANDVTFLSDECEIKSYNYVREVLGPEQMNSVLSMMPTDIDNYKFDINTKELASYYPIVEEYASIDAFGEISESIIDAFISGECVFDKDICTFIEAVAGLRHERLFEILDFVLYQKRYEQNNIMMCALKQMVKLPRTEQIEEYLIQYLTEKEDEFPSIGKFILDYL